MKLKLGHMNEDIAFRFGCTNTMISKDLPNLLPELSSSLKNLIVWPSKIEIKENLPKSFRIKYRDCNCIINCSEIFIERPKNLIARAQTWSNYKYNNTIKHLIRISPAGAVPILSKG